MIDGLLFGFRVTLRYRPSSLSLSWQLNSDHANLFSLERTKYADKVRFCNDILQPIVMILPRRQLEVSGRKWRCARPRQVPVDRNGGAVSVRLNYDYHSTRCLFKYDKP